MDVKVKSYLYENDLGSTELSNITLGLDKEDVELFNSGTPIEDLDYDINGTDIVKAERIIAFDFYKNNYKNILSGVYELNCDEIRAIQHFMGLNQLQFAKIIGLDRGSLANIYKRNSCSHPVQILVIERLGMELSTKGSSKALYNAMSNLEYNDSALKQDDEISSKISKIRFGMQVA